MPDEPREHSALLQTVGLIVGLVVVAGVVLAVLAVSVSYQHDRPGPAEPAPSLGVPIGADDGPPDTAQANYIKTLADDRKSLFGGNVATDGPVHAKAADIADLNVGVCIQPASPALTVKSPRPGQTSHIMVGGRVKAKAVAADPSLRVTAVSSPVQTVTPPQESISRSDSCAHWDFEVVGTKAGHFRIDVVVTSLETDSDVALDEARLKVPVTIRATNATRARQVAHALDSPVVAPVVVAAILGLGSLAFPRVRRAVTTGLRRLGWRKRVRDRRPSRPRDDDQDASGV